HIVPECSAGNPREERPGGEVVLRGILALSQKKAGLAASFQVHYDWRRLPREGTGQHGRRIGTNVDRPSSVPLRRRHLYRPERWGPGGAVPGVPGRGGRTGL